MVRDIFEYSREMVMGTQSKAFQEHVDNEIQVVWPLHFMRIVRRESFEVAA